jgi:TRAP-type transport system periplasmic protein
MKLATTLLCAAVLALAAASAAAAPLTLRFGSPFVTNSNLHKAMLKFAEIVEQESKGEVKVQVYADSQIGDILQLVSGMQLGTVDMAYLGVANAGQLKGGAPLNISYVPYLYKSKAKATEIMNGPIFKEMYENLAQQSGLRIFAVAGARSPRAIVTTKGPIKKPEDLKGLRLRIPPIEMFRGMFEQLGVKVVPLGLNDVYMAISRGQVEGQDNGFDLTLSFRFHEVSKHWSATDHVFDVAAWYISEKRWKALTPQQQALFVKAAQAGGKLATELGEEIDKTGREDLKKAGVTYTEPDIAAFRAAWKDVHKPYEDKGVWPKGLVDKIRAMQ